MFIQNSIILDELLPFLKGQVPNVTKISPLAVQCKWKVEELYWEKVKNVSNRFNKENEDINGQVDRAVTNFMKNLKINVKEKKFCYEAIKKLKWFS